ncbi:hypothetical protein [Streptomyces wuyuanensis]|uniref:hypothetical protein n=1 Tax=Streptomyces wuyuanensis TaxID=1196353 RepID=UPI00342FAC8A
MADFIVRTTDLVIVNFLPVTVVAPPGLMKGSASKTKAVGLPVCLVGDEASVPLFQSGMFPYMNPPYTIPGMGQISLELDGKNKSEKTQCEGKGIIVKGSKFKAKLKVTAPAMQPGATPKPDDKNEYSGEAVFVTSNSMVKSG